MEYSSIPFLYFTCVHTGSVLEAYADIGKTERDKNEKRCDFSFVSKSLFHAEKMPKTMFYIEKIYADKERTRQLLLREQTWYIEKKRAFRRILDGQRLMGRHSRISASDFLSFVRTSSAP